MKWLIVNPMTQAEVDALLAGFAAAGGAVAEPRINVVIEMADPTPEKVAALEEGAAEHGVMLHRLPD